MDGAAAILAGGAIVRGFVRVTAPAGRTITHEGISVRLTSGLFTLGEMNTRDLVVDDLASLNPWSPRVI